MTWLKEFVSYKSNCVLCDTPLTLGIVSSKFRECKIVGNKIEVEIKPTFFGRGELIAKLSICMDTLDFCFNFEDLSMVTLKTITSIKNIFNYNMSIYFTNNCTKCNNYKLHSTCFSFVWKNAKISNVFPQIVNERINIIDYDNSFIYVLFYYSILDKTEVYYGSMKNYLDDSNLTKKIESLDTFLLPNELTIKHIEFTTKEMMLDRLKTFIVFS